MSENLKNRRIVLTGVSRGVGFEAAKLLLAGGSEVLGVARDKDRLKDASARLAKLGRFEALHADLSEREAGGRIAQAVEKLWGALDVLVNNAAILEYHKSFEDEGPEVLERTLTVNVLGPHRLILALLPLLKKGREPRVINVSSGAGKRGSVESDATMPSYKLTKYTLNGLTLLFSRQLAGQVAVNSLDPGWLKTDMGGKDAPGEPADGGHRILELLRKPWSETGKFWYGEQQIDF